MTVSNDDNYDSFSFMSFCLFIAIVFNRLLMLFLWLLIIVIVSNSSSWKF